MSDKNREQRLRYALNKAGYLLRKSRVRSIHLNDLGDYRVVDLYTNAVAVGSRFE
jgi:hypothetical protein